MKKFLLSLMTIMSLVWTNSFAQTPELGTETNPFLIETAAPTSSTRWARASRMLSVSRVAARAPISS